MDYLPWNIVAFLDEIVERILLLRLGGSYIFIHRFLLDYFASLTPAAQLELSGTAKDGAASQAERFRRMPAQPRRILKRGSTVLVALVGLFLSSNLIITHFQEERRAASAEHATATAIWQRGDDFLASLRYPSIFPGQGTIFSLSSLQGDDLTSFEDNPAAGCYEQKDGYHISQQGIGTASFCGYKDVLSDVAIQVQMNILHGGCGGIAFRNDPNTGSGYFFYVCQNGTYGLLRNGPQTNAVSLIRSTPVPGGIQRTNTLAVVALGSTITLFIKEQQIATIQDNQYTQGVTAIAARAVDSPAEVVYSNIRIWKVQDSPTALAPI